MTGIGDGVDYMVDGKKMSTQNQWIQINIAAALHSVAGWHFWFSIQNIILECRQPSMLQTFLTQSVQSFSKVFLFSSFKYVLEIYFGADSIAAKVSSSTFRLVFFFSFGANWHPTNSHSFSEPSLCSERNEFNMEYSIKLIITNPFYIRRMYEHV